jgi:hypothetical protein
MRCCGARKEAYAAAFARVLNEAGVEDLSKVADGLRKESGNDL